jgi:hypothetical protein
MITINNIRADTLQCTREFPDYIYSINLYISKMSDTKFRIYTYEKRNNTYWYCQYNLRKEFFIQPK